MTCVSDEREYVRVLWPTVFETRPRDRFRVITVNIFPDRAYTGCAVRHTVTATTIRRSRSETELRADTEQRSRLGDEFCSFVYFRSADTLLYTIRVRPESAMGRRVSGN